MIFGKDICTQDLAIWNENNLKHVSVLHISYLRFSEFQLLLLYTTNLRRLLSWSVREGLWSAEEGWILMDTGGPSINGHIFVIPFPQEYLDMKGSCGRIRFQWRQKTVREEPVCPQLWNPITWIESQELSLQHLQLSAGFKMPAISRNKINQITLNCEILKMHS